MTEETIFLGPAPAEESCAQLGSDDYERNAKAECRHFIAAIRKMCGREPEGARLCVVAQPHDFGQYYEVAIRYDANDRAAAEYAQRCDEHAPATWEEAGIAPPLQAERGR
jgi:hypothetical protein